MCLPDPGLHMLNVNPACAQWTRVNIDTLGPSVVGFVGAGDLEDDGDVDLLVSRVATEQPLTGASSWYGAPTWTVHEMTTNIGLMNVADINKDGKNDI